MVEVVNQTFYSALKNANFILWGPRRGEIISNQTKQFLLLHLVHFKCHPLGQNYY